MSKYFLLLQFQSIFSENVYIRAFDLGGGGLKTALFSYDQEMQKMESIEEVVQLGRCPDEEIQSGYLFGFSLAGLDKLRSNPLSTFDLSIICAIPRNKVRCIGDEMAHLIASLLKID
ncbi:MAG: hypothetical protein V4489_09470 [Chlamydiota bacterium]